MEAIAIGPVSYTHLDVYKRQVTHYVGVTGVMHIREGETVNSMMKDEGAGMEKTSLPFSVTLNDFRSVSYTHLLRK